MNTKTTYTILHFPIDEDAWQLCEASFVWLSQTEEGKQATDNLVDVLDEVIALHPETLIFPLQAGSSNIAQEEIYPFLAAKGFEKMPMQWSPSEGMPDYDMFVRGEMDMGSWAAILEKLQDRISIP